MNSQESNGLKLESSDNDQTSSASIESEVSGTGSSQNNDFEINDSVLSTKAVDSNHSDDLISIHDVKLEFDEHVSDKSTVLSKCGVSSSKEPMDLSKLSQNNAENRVTVKLIACVICNKLFKRMFNLQRHIAVTHTGQKSFVCEICGKACAHAYTLKQHMLLHTRSKVFSCDKCDKQYTDPSSLRRHKLKQHARDQGEQGNRLLRSFFPCCFIKCVCINVALCGRKCDKYTLFKQLQKKTVNFSV